MAFFILLSRSSALLVLWWLLIHAGFRIIRYPVTWKVIACLRRYLLFIQIALFLAIGITLAAAAHLVEFQVPRWAGAWWI